jgi:hypothetical protein
LVPALVDRGVVERDEKPVDAPAHGPVSPPAGKFMVQAGNVAALTPPPKAEVDTPRASDAPADVHVHIDRVVVTRAPGPPPPPAPPPPTPPRSTVDHEAYLARRREGR